MCEKALADYMESKRRSFPRFYFVSTADLLDVLSNGNSPHKASIMQLASPPCPPVLVPRLQRCQLAPPNPAALTRPALTHELQFSDDPSPPIIHSSLPL